MPSLMEKGFINLHKGLYTLSGGKLLGSFDKMPALMLTTTGRKSGKARTTPLMFIEEAGFVVVGSAAGRDQHPAWYLNLVAEPRARVRVGKAETAVQARITGGEERDRFFTAFSETAKRYAGYQAKTDREIPVVVLERQG